MKKIAVVLTFLLIMLASVNTRAADNKVLFSDTLTMDTGKKLTITASFATDINGTLCTPSDPNRPYVLTLTITNVNADSVYLSSYQITTLKKNEDPNGLSRFNVINSTITDGTYTIDNGIWNLADIDSLAAGKSISLTLRVSLLEGNITDNTNFVVRVVSNNGNFTGATKSLSTRKDDIKFDFAKATAGEFSFPTIDSTKIVKTQVIKDSNKWLTYTWSQSTSDQVDTVIYVSNTDSYIEDVNPVSNKSTPNDKHFTSQIIPDSIVFFYESSCSQSSKTAEAKVFIDIWKMYRPQLSCMDDMKVLTYGDMFSDANMIGRIDTAYVANPFDVKNNPNNRCSWGKDTIQVKDAAIITWVFLDSMLGNNDKAPRELKLYGDPSAPNSDYSEIYPGRHKIIYSYWYEHADADSVGRDSVFYLIPFKMGAAPDKDTAQSGVAERLAPLKNDTLHNNLDYRKFYNLKIGQPEHGTAYVGDIEDGPVGSPDSSYTDSIVYYTANKGYFGPDTIWYILEDTSFVKGTTDGGYRAESRKSVSFIAIDVQPSYDLAVSKAAYTKNKTTGDWGTSGNFAVDDTVMFVVAVTNKGSNSMFGTFTIYDTIPVSYLRGDTTNGAAGSLPISSFVKHGNKRYIPNQDSTIAPPTSSTDSVLEWKFDNTASGDSLTWHNDDSVLTITYYYVAKAMGTGLHSNAYVYPGKPESEIYGDYPDVDTANNTGSVIITIGDYYDIKIIRKDSIGGGDTIVCDSLGQALPIRITVYNNGSGTIDSVVVRDTLTGGVGFDGTANPSVVVVNDSILTWSIAGPIQPGDSVEFTYHPKLVGQGLFATTSTAVAYANGVPVTEVDSSDNRDTLYVSYRFASELALKKYAVDMHGSYEKPAVKQFFDGDTVYYRLKISRVNGTQSASGIVVTDTMPRKDYIALDPVKTVANAAANGHNVSVNDSIVVWNLSKLEEGAEDSITVYGVALIAAVDSGDIVNRAHMTFRELIQQHSDSVMCDSAVITVANGLKIKTIATCDEPAVGYMQGDTATFTVKLYHVKGTEPAKNVTVRTLYYPGEDTLRNIVGSLIFTKSTHAGYTPVVGEFANGQLVWNIDSITPADTFLLTYKTVIGSDVGDVAPFLFFHDKIGADKSEDTAHVRLKTVNEASHNVAVRIAKYHYPSMVEVTTDNPIQIGEQFMLSLTVDNQREAISGVVLVDTLSAAMDEPQVSHTTGYNIITLPSSDGRRVASWNIGALRKEERAAYSMLMSISQEGAYSHSVRVSCNEREANVFDNYLHDFIRVFAYTEVGVEYKLLPTYVERADSVLEGDTVRILLITNNLVGRTAEIVQTTGAVDTSKFSYVGNDKGYIYDATANAVKHTFDTLAAFASDTCVITLVAKMVETFPTHPTMSARVTYSDEGHDRKSDSTLTPTPSIYYRPADLSITHTVTPKLIQIADAKTSIFTYTVRLGKRKYNDNITKYTDVVITDTLPLGVSPAMQPDGTTLDSTKYSIAPAGMNQDARGRWVVEWNGDTINEATAPVDFVIDSCFLVDSSDAEIGPYIANAGVQAATREVSLNNNSDTAAFRIAAPVDLQLTMTLKHNGSAIGTFVQGDTISVILDLKNEGNDPAYNVKIAIPVIAGFKVLDGVPAQNPTHDTIPVTAALNKDVLETRTMHYVCTVSGTYTVTATAFADSVNLPTTPIKKYRPVAVASKPLQVSNGADMEIKINWINLPNYYNGNYFTLQIDMKNIGTYQADSVRQSFVVPDMFDYYITEVSPLGWENVYVHNSETGAINFAKDTFDAKQTFFMTIRLTPKYSGTATLSTAVSCKNDKDLLNNAVTKHLTINPNPYNIAVDMVATADNADTTFSWEALPLNIYNTDEKPLEYSIRVRNKGFLQANNVAVSYRLGTSCLELVDIPAADIGNVLVQNEDIAWAIPTVYTGEMYSMNLQVKPTRKGVTYDTARVVVSDQKWDEARATKNDNQAAAKISVFYNIDTWSTMDMFSPNGDGKNDYFIIRELLSPIFADNELTIFNRYGTEVFHAKPYNNDWGAEGLADGTYFYKLTIKVNGKTEDKGGYVTVRRKKN
ncbi:MAG: gliding motility-associated C-terminal domain-containing protein [Prevotellaceae bacterium]|nr:gliding motility-associated C-terminal domain-containing protein [Prevotellaceae bacterium]